MTQVHQYTPDETALVVLEMGMIRTNRIIEDDGGDIFADETRWDNEEAFSQIIALRKQYPHYGVFVTTKDVKGLFPHLHQFAFRFLLAWNDWEDPMTALVGEMTDKDRVEFQLRYSQ